MAKPPVLTHLKKGLAVGAKAHKGLADTLNWVIDFCDNLQGDNNNITLTNTPDGTHPRIDFAGGFNAGEVRGSDVGEEGGGGGGECSCDITPYYEESSENAHIATWTNGTETKEIYAPTNDSDVQLIYDVYMSKTPFFYNPSSKTIVNCWFYIGRELLSISNQPFQGAGTYYLQITYNAASSGEDPSRSLAVYYQQHDVSVDETTGYPDSATMNQNMTNSDTITYKKLWTINKLGAPVFDWRQTPVIPFYSI